MKNKKILVTLISILIIGIVNLVACDNKLTSKSKKDITLSNLELDKDDVLSVSNKNNETIKVSDDFSLKFDFFLKKKDKLQLNGESSKDFKPEQGFVFTSNIDLYVGDENENVSRIIEFSAFPFNDYNDYKVIEVNDKRVVISLKCIKELYKEDNGAFNSVEDVCSQVAVIVKAFSGVQKKDDNSCSVVINAYLYSYSSLEDKNKEMFSIKKLDDLIINECI